MRCSSGVVAGGRGDNYPTLNFQLSINCWKIFLLLVNCHPKTQEIGAEKLHFKETLAQK